MPELLQKTVIWKDYHQYSGRRRALQGVIHWELCTRGSCVALKMGLGLEYHFPCQLNLWSLTVHYTTKIQ